LFDPRGPMHDQRIADATAMSVHLEPLERRVAGVPPAGRIVVPEELGAQPIDLGQLFFETLFEELVVPPDVHVPEFAALGRRAVVGEQDDERVVEQAACLEVVDEPADLFVGVVQESCEHLLVARTQSALIYAHRIPWLDVLVERRQARARRHDAEFQLALEPLLSHGVPAGVEATLVFVDVPARCLVRRVTCAERNVGEERLAWSCGLLVADHADGLVDQVFGEVISGPPRRRDRVVVADQFRVPVIHQRKQEAVVAIEAAAERPLPVRTRAGHVARARQVPLADGEAVVTNGSQHFGKGRRALRYFALVARIARAPVGNHAHADCVMIPAREQRCPCRRAHRGRVKVVVAAPPGSEGVDAWRVDAGAVAAELRKAYVVEHDDDYVRRAIGRPHDRLQPWRRVPITSGDDPGEGLGFHSPLQPDSGGITVDLAAGADRIEQRPVTLFDLEAQRKRRPRLHVDGLHDPVVAVVAPDDDRDQG
jgi:hypothetical protein